MGVVISYHHGVIESKDEVITRILWFIQSNDYRIILQYMNYYDGTGFSTILHPSNGLCLESKNDNAVVVDSPGEIS